MQCSLRTNVPFEKREAYNADEVFVIFLLLRKSNLHKTILNNYLNEFNWLLYM